MRGKQTVDLCGFRPFRITPACAGKTGRIKKCSGRSSDHPRVCGENIDVHERLVERVGSPPRVRGKLPAGVCRIQAERITPACAGKTHRPEQDHAARADHPRVCGENASRRSRCSTSCGSPPRVRGKLCDHLVVIFCMRITPACAGKTCRRHTNARRCTDHPRVCGENITLVTLMGVDYGSPPRVRGKRAPLMSLATA